MMSDPSYNATLGSVIMDQGSQPSEQDQQPIKTPPEIVDQEIRSMMNHRKQTSRDWKLQNKLPIWDKCWNHYKQVPDRTNKDIWQMSTFIPASPKVAEVIASNMHAALLAPDKPVEYQSRQPMFDPIVNDVNDLVAVDCDKSDWKVHWTDILRTLCVIGTGIGKIEYKKESAWVTIKERMKQIPGMDFMRQLIGLPTAPTETTIQKRMLVKDYACMKNVDPYNIYPEPGSIEIDKDHWIIEEGKICNYKLQELLQDQDNPIRNVTPEVLMSNPRTLQNADSQEKDDILGEKVNTTAYLDPDQEHVLDEYWGPAPIWMVQPELYGSEEHKFQMVNAWFWLIDGIHVVRAQINPFRDAEPPYVKGVYIRVPGQFWGIGPLELMTGLQIELNEIRNSRMDNVNLILNKPVAVLKDTISPGQSSRLVSDPGQLWLFENIDDIRKAFFPIDFPDVTSDSWKSSGEIYNEIQEVTAANKATVGTGGGEDQSGGSTFRGQLLNKQTSSERFIMYSRIMEKTGLAKAYAKMYQRIYQFKGWKEAEQILGPERAQKFQFTAPEELEMMAKIVPLGVTTMENKGVKLAQMADEFKLFSGHPWFKEIDFARRMIVTGGDVDPDMFIMSDEELKIYNQVKMQALQGPQMPGMDQPGLNQPPQGPPQIQHNSPVAGNTPPPMNGMPRPSMPVRGPGASPIDLSGRPMS